MPRTFGKLSLNGQYITGFVPVRCRTELGMCTGHLEIPEKIAVSVQIPNYVLHLKDSREIEISFSGVCDNLAYFHSVSADVEHLDPVLA